MIMPFTMIRKFKACLGGFDFLPNFCFDKFDDLLNRSATLLKALKKVESLSNRSHIKFEFD